MNATIITSEHLTECCVLLRSINVHPDSAGNFTASRITLSLRADAKSILNSLFRRGWVKINPSAGHVPPLPRYNGRLRPLDDGPFTGDEVYRRLTPALLRYIIRKGNERLSESDFIWLGPYFLCAKFAADELEDRGRSIEEGAQ